MIFYQLFHVFICFLSILTSLFFLLNFDLEGNGHQSSSELNFLAASNVFILLQVPQHPKHKGAASDSDVIIRATSRRHGVGRSDPVRRGLTNRIMIKVLENAENTVGIRHP